MRYTSRSQFAGHGRGEPSEPFMYREKLGTPAQPQHNARSVIVEGDDKRRDHGGHVPRNWSNDDLQRLNNNEHQRRQYTPSLKNLSHELMIRIKTKEPTVDGGFRPREPRSQGEDGR